MPRNVPPVVPAGRMRDSRQPVLPAPGGLTLRPWRPADAGVVLAAYADPDISHWHRRTLASEDEARDLIEGWNRGWRAETDGGWAIVSGDPGQVAGRVTLGKISLEGGLARCGYWVLPAARGTGIATRAVLGLSRWALDDLGLHRLELGHSVANEASCRVASKAGFRLEGTLHAALLHPDGWHDMHLHAQIRDSGPRPAAASDADGALDRP